MAAHVASHAINHHYHHTNHDRHHHGTINGMEKLISDLTAVTNHSESANTNDEVITLQFVIIILIDSLCDALIMT